MERGIPVSYAVALATVLLVFPGVFSEAVCGTKARACGEFCCCQRGSILNTRLRWSEGTKVVCTHQQLTAVPLSLPPNTQELDLSFNNISSLPQGCFSHLPRLRSLVLMSNRLTSLDKDAFQGLPQLEILNLKLNWFQNVPKQAFHKDLMNLGRLHLDSNWISEIPHDTFVNLTSLYHLSLEHNKLSSLPVGALDTLPRLETLMLSYNRIASLPTNAFAANRQLIKVSVSHNRIEHITATSFARLPYLTELSFRSNLIASIEHTAFRDFPSLKKLEIVDVKNLSVFPDLTGTYNLEDLVIERCSLRSIPEDFCHNRTALKTLNLHNNQLGTLPHTLSLCSELTLINLNINRLTSLEGKPFAGLKVLYDLSLSHNRITSVPTEAFEDLITLNTLAIGHNQIADIDTQAFASCTNLEKLDLRSNAIPSLPTAGLANLVVIRINDNEPLENFPSPSDLPNIYEIETEYAYHCCDYLDLMEQYQSSLVEPDFSEKVEWDDASEYSDNNQTLNSIPWNSDIEGFSFLFSAVAFLRGPSPGPYVALPHNISCKPKPGPFLPCVDLFGSWPLRIGVWLVFLLAIVGNAIVIVVILVSHTKMTVPRFLICNLAFADFFLGVYLSFLAGVDASTHGSFRKHGANWQLSTGCKLAGFLAVFSSEFSIYTLSVITLERFYAIKHALHLEKRLKLPHAVCVMGCGLLFSVICATMPLVNVSHYHKFPVCLPFDVESTVAKVYVVGMLGLNVLAFVIILACYASIYLSIQGSHAWNCNDSRVARRMSLLVFTDFICLAPIAFFSLTSVLGLRLISLNGAKVLTIFVLPLNSCANPFLYTILTKQFKKDCRMILRSLSNRVFRHRSMSPSVTLSLGRNPSRSTQAHQTSQLRWRTNGSISQDATGDPCLVSFKTENGEASSSNVYTVANFGPANHRGKTKTSSAPPLNIPSIHDCSPSDSSTMLDPMPANAVLDDPRRGSRSPLLDLVTQVRSRTQDLRPRSRLRRKFSIPIPFLFSTRSPGKAGPDGTVPKSSPLGHRHKRSHSVTEGLLHKMGRKKPLTSVKSAPGNARAVCGSSEHLSKIGNGHAVPSQVIKNLDQKVASMEDQVTETPTKASCHPSQPLPDGTSPEHSRTDDQRLLRETRSSTDDLDPVKTDDERLLRASHDNPGIQDQFSSASSSPVHRRPDDLSLAPAPTVATVSGHPDRDSGLGTASSPLSESAECMRFLPDDVHPDRDSSQTDSPRARPSASVLGGKLIHFTKSDQDPHNLPRSPTKEKLLPGPKESVV